MGSTDETKQDIDVAGNTTTTNDNTNDTSNNNESTAGAGEAEAGAGTDAGARGGGKAQAFHPLDSDPSVTVLSLQLPPAPIIEKDESLDTVVPTQQKEAFFHICLDTSGSMAGSGIQCAKEAMKELFSHLVNNCRIPPERISVYLYSMSCSVRRMGLVDDLRWMDSIKAGGGTSFGSVFEQLIATIKGQIESVSQQSGSTSNNNTNTSLDVSSTLFFFTDGADGDHGNTRRQQEILEPLLKNTPRLETTVHSFGFTSGHDAKLLSWLTSTGTDMGCFQYIKESKDIRGAMERTAGLLDSTAMKVQRKVDLYLPTDENHENDWVTVKLTADDVTGSTVARNRTFTGTTLLWREHVPDPQEGQSLVGTATTTPVAGIDGVKEMKVDWLAEDDVARILGMTTFIQHELLRMVEQINAIGSSRESADEKRAKLGQIDVQTEAYAKVLGTLGFASARIKIKTTREPCMIACAQTRSILQSFLTLKADAHKQGGSISNTSLATFNSLAYGQITEAKLKAKLDSRVGKNTALFADLDQKVEEIVKGLDLDKIEAEESEEKLRELSCAFSTNSYVDALRDGDCLCMTLDVSRGAGAIADPSQLVIKSIFPTYLTSSMFTMALGHSLAQNNPEDVHGGFDRGSDASIAPGLAHENITAVMPLYINEHHWKVARLRMKPILGYVVTLDATGYTYSQSTTVPFLVLVKALESHPMTEFKQRQIRLILETCDQIYIHSNSLRQSTKTMVQQFCDSHTQRTVDVVTNNYVFLGQVICALRAGDISVEEMRGLYDRFETTMVEEQIRRDMSWRVSGDLMGGVMEWFDVNRQRDIIAPGRRYREQHDAYVRELEKNSGGEGVEVHYKELLRKARADQKVPVKESAVTGTVSPTAVTTSLSISDEETNSGEKQLEAPEFKVPTIDPVAWELTEASLDRLSLIQDAVSMGVDKIRRLLAVIRSPLDADLSEVLTKRLGAVAHGGLADEFFARFSRKTVLATLLQAYAHTRNSDRRSVENLMTPFERPLPLGPNGKVLRDDDKATDEAIQFLHSLYQAKMTMMVQEIIAQVEEAYLESKKNFAASTFVNTLDPDVAAGVLIDAKTRGGAGGKLVTLCARMKMVGAVREKILMMLQGVYEGVTLFSDHHSVDAEKEKGKNVWYPCKQTLYKMFTNHHDEFSLSEWRNVHPNRYEDYISCRYVLDGYLDELTSEEQAECKGVFYGRYPDSGRAALSSQTGIKVSQKLSDAWKQATAPGSNVRAVKVSIINESLEDDGLFDIQGTFEKDFAIMHENLAEKQPAYFLVRLGDSKASSEWIFLCYVPDVAPIRQKMIYAATRASLTKDLGDSHFTDSIYGTNKGDFTLEGYKKHRASLAAPKPLSERERQLAEIRANEKTLVESMKGGAYRKAHAPGMSFPLTDKAVAALKKLVLAAPVSAAPKKKVAVASAVPKKFSSPASTPLPASPVASQESSTIKALEQVTVADDEWDDDAANEKKENTVAEEQETAAEAEREKEAETEAAVEEEEEEEPEVVAKQERTINFVKLAIDAENETIDLVSEAKLGANEVHKNIDEEAPRFTFYAYEHTHNGTAHDSLVFMYTCPSKSKIRERMLYSSCRAGVLQAAKDDAGLNVDKKLETTDVSDLTEAFILDELHPKAQSAFGTTTGANSPRGFSKPARPGARRVM
ncbi:hypothetical protein BG015_008150 [Linnemannia schmuckeri]|uniref:Twinfilin n=1 Tax=Linnemannia schmuckeri TaxID=64567 RepID=A0A9P5S8I5_9FUNG|nr:hypothetical protein BG015_008150 [Linnemannia schmuckeri]